MIEFIDLFAGVGGFRLGLERQGHECVWSCEKDKYCRQVYRKRWEEPEANDVREVDGGQVPDHDLLAAGFPCQSFSIAGERKGFEDTRGTLFHEICRIARAKRPEVLLLENVKGLLSTQDREAFRVVLESLDGLGYDVEWQVLNSKDFGVPQNRPRVFIIGHLDGFADGGRQVFPITGEDGGDSGEDGRGVERIASRFGNKQSGGVYDKKGFCPTVHYGKRGPQPHHVLEHRGHTNKPVRQLDISPALRHESHGHQPKVLDDTVVEADPELKDIYPTIRSNCHGNRAKILHNLYEGFDEGIRKFKKHSPAIRTPKGGGHIPSVLDTMPVRLMPNATSKLPFMGSAPKPKDIEDEVSFPLQTSGGYDLAVQTGKSTRQAEKDGDDDIYGGYKRIRKLTPMECERLQGFPDGWTEDGLDEDGEHVEISDTQRYKMMGNAVTVNVVEFLGGKIKEVYEN